MSVEETNEVISLEELESYEPQTLEEQEYDNWFWDDGGDKE